MGGKSSKLFEEAQERGTATLNLSNNRLNMLSPEVELLKDTLLRLSLSHNMLSYLPYEASKLLKLRYINLSHNKFKMFPTVLCELPVLEVVDLSNNKIKRLPSKLGSSLRVLSIANNRVTVLSSCIPEAPSLQVLHVEGNPIVFPPKEIVRKRKGVTDEEWLQELREWLMFNESTILLERKKHEGPKREREEENDGLSEMERKSVALQKLMMEQEELKQLLRRKHEEELKILKEEQSFQIRRHSTQNGLTATPAMALIRTKLQRPSMEGERDSTVISDDCEDVCNRYFRSSDLERLTGREKSTLQACKSLLHADLQIWKAIKQGLQSSSNRNLTKILWRVQHENSERIIHMVSKMEECELKKKSSAMALKELETAGLSLTQSLRRLIKSFLPLLGILTKTTDIRIIKNILLSWSNSAGDMYEATELLTNRFPDLSESPFGLRARSGSNEFLIRAVTNALEVAQDLIPALRTSNEIARSAGEKDCNHRFLNILSGFQKQIESAEETTENLGTAVSGWEQGTVETTTLAICAKAFVNSVGRMMVVAKIIDSEHSFDGQVGDLLVEMGSTSQFLMACLSPSLVEEEEASLPRPSLDVRGYMQTRGHIGL